MSGRQSLMSQNGEYKVEMQADGNLVVSALGRALWSSGTYGRPGAVACVQLDGNLVVYLGSTAIWSTRTGGHTSAGYFLAMQNDGNLVIYSPGRSPLWNIGPRSPGGGDLVNHAHGLCLDAAANATTTTGAPCNSGRVGAVQTSTGFTLATRS